MKRTGELKKEEINELKAKNGGIVYQLEVEFSDEDTGVGYIRSPKRQTLSMAMGQFQRDPLRATNILIAGSWLAGDERLKDPNNSEALLALSSQVDEIIKVKSATVKKI